MKTYQLPSAHLLDKEKGANKVTEKEISDNKTRITGTLDSFGIKIKSIAATVGATFTMYEVIPADGVKLSKIKTLEDNLAMNLSAMSVRVSILAGRGTVGIEVPNINKQIVTIRSVIESPEFVNSTMELPIALGMDVYNKPVIMDLAKMPHLLMAGATGQGKSVGLNALLISLLCKKNPEEMKLILIDPKKVELSMYDKIGKKYLIRPVITDKIEAMYILRDLCVVMDDRYDSLKKAQVRNLKEYNAKNPLTKLPYIVVVIDEFADLGQGIEGSLTRLAQLARAVGIHVVIATQRPSVDVVTGLIKANFPARIAFKVASKTDSRTIIDAAGADKLIGRGDMLFTNGIDPHRIQGAYVDTLEVERIVDFIAAQRVDDQHDLMITDDMVEESPVVIDQLVVIAKQNGYNTVAQIQLKLKVGYTRAKGILEQMNNQ